MTQSGRVFPIPASGVPPLDLVRCCTAAVWCTAARNHNFCGKTAVIVRRKLHDFRLERAPESLHTARVFILYAVRMRRPALLPAFDARQRSIEVGHDLSGDFKIFREDVSLDGHPTAGNGKTPNTGLQRWPQACLCVKCHRTGHTVST